MMEVPKVIVNVLHVNVRVKQCGCRCPAKQFENAAVDKMSRLCAEFLLREVVRAYATT